MNHDIDPEILEQETQLTRATRAFDVNALDRLYADDLMFAGVTGVVCDKAGVMAEARSGADAHAQAADQPQMPAVVGYEKDELRIIRHGETGVASFRFGVTVRANGQEVVRRYRTTNVWIRRGGRWQVCAAQTVAMG